MVARLPVARDQVATLPGDVRPVAAGGGATDRAALLSTAADARAALDAGLTPSAGELRTLELLGLEPGVLSELRASSAGRPSVGGMSVGGMSVISEDLPPGEMPGRGAGRPSSLESGALAEDALGGMRLSGLDTGLRERLQAERDKRMAAGED